MAEILSGSSITSITPAESGSLAEGAIVPAEPRGYAIKIKRFSAAGSVNPLEVLIPENAKLESIKNNPLLLAAVMKDGDPVWQGYDAGFVLIACMKAASLGLDILEGDIYPVEGRLGVSDWAKIKYARARGYRAEVDMVEGEQMTVPWETAKNKGVWTGANLKCTVRVYSQDDKLLTTYTTTLRAWFEGRSREWRDRSAESLRRKTIARAYQEVCPVGVDPEEAPPIDFSAKGGKE